MHGQGLDEIALAGETRVMALENGTVREFTVSPEDAGLRQAPPEAVRGGTPPENAAALHALLQGAPGPYRDIVLLNAAAALVVAGRTGDLRDGAAQAARSIDSGAAVEVAGPPEGRHRTMSAPQVFIPTPAAGVPDILARILADKQEEVRARSADFPQFELERLAQHAPPPRDFTRALCNAVADGRVGLWPRSSAPRPRAG